MMNKHHSLVLVGGCEVKNRMMMTGEEVSWRMSFHKTKKKKKKKSS